MRCLPFYIGTDRKRDGLGFNHIIVMMYGREIWNNVRRILITYTRIFPFHFPITAHILYEATTSAPLMCRRSHLRMIFQGHPKSSAIRRD